MTKHLVRDMMKPFLRSLPHCQKNAVFANKEWRELDFAPQ